MFSVSNHTRVLLLCAFHLAARLSGSRDLSFAGILAASWPALKQIPHHPPTQTLHRYDTDSLFSSGCVLDRHCSIQTCAQRAAPDLRVRIRTDSGQLSAFLFYRKRNNPKKNDAMTRSLTVAWECRQQNAGRWLAFGNVSPEPDLGPRLLTIAIIVVSASQRRACVNTIVTRTSNM
jgi:hypothetical protein